MEVTSPKVRALKDAKRDFFAALALKFFTDHFSVPLKNKKQGPGALAFCSLIASMKRRLSLVKQPLSDLFERDLFPVEQNSDAINTPGQPHKQDGRGDDEEQR